VEDDYAILVNRGNPFSDIYASDWFYYEVMWAYAMGIMKGVAQDMFGPETLLTREMFVTMLYRFANHPGNHPGASATPPGEGNEPFLDVAEGQWYTDAIKWAAQNGIVLGIGNNTFGVGQRLTGEQMVTILYRYAQYKDLDISAVGQPDTAINTDNISEWALDAYKWAASANMVNWGVNGMLDPAGSVTRAQSAVVLERFSQIYGPRVIVIDEHLLDEQSLTYLSQV